MSVVDIDLILERLSSKFRRIFYDRDFVCCVQEDLEVILKNRKRCFVVLFPLLDPNYLRAVEYQAKFFDLEVFTVGTEKFSILAVCDKRYLTMKSAASEEQILQVTDDTCGVGSSIKKKRPERKLYIPPAQRRLSSNEISAPQNLKNEQTVPEKIGITSYCTRRRELHKKGKQARRESDYTSEIDNSFLKNVEFAENNLCENFTFLWWKHSLFKRRRYSEKLMFNSITNFKHKCIINHFDGSNLFRLCDNLFTLYILDFEYVLWQPKRYILDPLRGNNLRVISACNVDILSAEVDVNSKIALTTILFPKKTYIDILDTYSIYCDFDVLLLRNREPTNFLDICSSGYYYMLSQDNFDCQSIQESVDVLTHDCHNVKSVVKEDKPSANTYIIDLNKEINDKNLSADKQSLIQTKSLLEKHNNINKVSKNIDYYKNSINISDDGKKKKNSLEEEKEIMRKTKENINRKTRPIMKYVEEVDDTLKIEKNDVNTWEDLFDENGQLPENFLNEIVQKVGNDVTIVKAKENYSDYFMKHVNKEELEHMVELYDFPASLETHDLIHAFSELQSDAMYIKWVNDTHALLVLGSSSQAQKAMNIQNPLIKVRPMTAASKISLLTACKNELKPAMKRPPTNLQTARRLITSHLGTKSGITKERNAKERDDLKAAKELKKLVKQNEQAAWEGNLKSSLS